MDLSNVTVRYGKPTPLQVQLAAGEMRVWHGTPRTWKDTTIVAARVGLKGPSFSLTHELAEHVKRRELPANVRALFLDAYDGPWVRGRIERLFGVSSPPEQERYEKTGLHAEFVAVFSEQGGGLVAVPFWCTDHYLKSGLMFSEKEDRPPAELCDSIAEAFWGLLLADPYDLPDYNDRMFHSGAGVWLAFGVAHGKPFIDEQEEEPT
jgi:hypothetical protein